MGLHLEGSVDRDWQSLRYVVLGSSNFCNPSKAPKFSVPTAECQSTS